MVVAVVVVVGGGRVDDDGESHFLLIRLGIPLYWFVGHCDLGREYGVVSSYWRASLL